MKRTLHPPTAARRAITCSLVVAGTVGLTLAASMPANADEAVQTLRGADAPTLASALAGDNVTIVDAVASGSDVQVGSYTGLDLGQSDMASGVAVSSGSLVDADPSSDADVDFTRSALVGPNDSLTTSGDFGGPADPDLTALFQKTTYDAASLTLTVRPAGGDLHLSYLLGSEEYAHWSAQNYGDAAAIWVNGQLCSTVAGGPVGTATVNPETNAALYNANFSDKTPGTAFNTGFNGFTSALTCDASVVAGADATVKIAVADTVDGQGDTTLLLGAGSLTSTAAAPVPASTPAAVPGAGSGTDPGTGAAVADPASAQSTSQENQKAASTGGHLGSTGFDSTAFVISAAGMLLAGGLAVAVALRLRRRRQGAVAPSDGV